MGDSLSIRPGTVAFLALAAVVRAGPLHGFQVLRWIEESSEGRLLLEEGALYPALHRLEKKGWLSASWGVSSKGRRAKFYDATAAGRKALARETAEWREYVAAVGQVVEEEG